MLSLSNWLIGQMWQAMFLKIVFDNTARIETQTYIRWSWNVFLVTRKMKTLKIKTQYVQTWETSQDFLSCSLISSLPKRRLKIPSLGTFCPAQIHSLKYKFIEREFENNNNNRKNSNKPNGFAWRTWLCGFWVLQFFLKTGTRVLWLFISLGHLCTIVMHMGGKGQLAGVGSFLLLHASQGLDAAEAPFHAEPCRQPWVFILYRIRPHTG